MFIALANKIFGTPNQRVLNSIKKTVVEINELEPKISRLSDNDLKGQTEKLKNRLKAGETLDDILPEAFATVREAAKRTLGQRHYDVQLIGGIVLHRGMISEMRTGEGKTLVSTLPAYLNALTGEGVHIVTVNDYLVQRDAKWMSKIHEFLGLTVGYISGGITEEERQLAYKADITYGSNHEFGFDYLRDNMKYDPSTIVQRKLKYAIVDEVDSILIDEARTPLIISGPTDDHSELYIKINKLIPYLKPEHYEKDEKSRGIYLTDEGNHFVEEWLNEQGIMEGGLYEVGNITYLHHTNQALRAHLMFTRDVDYIVKNKEVLIIDEFTGRIMDGRRYSEGLHQALEAKENVSIKNENQTLASITYQNYFRLYEKLAGMTGTAMTEASEFREIYNLKVVEIPTNLPVKRIDEDDEVYRTSNEKYNAIIKLIKDRNKAGQPILVGTTSIEKSELISSMLQKEKIAHQVLNAKYHEQEAQIIAQAGRKGAVMIATNMAGRGTDIMLGGNLEMSIKNATIDLTDQEEIKRVTAKVTSDYHREKQEVLEAGGLLVVGTERHESRRIDNQLRGRSGRQGDPGRTKFFLSLEDDLMRIFGSDRLAETMKRLGMEEGVAISHPWVTKALQKAQQRVEARNYDIRKTLLRYDDVMNEQRVVIYEQRRDIIASNDVSEVIQNMLIENVQEIIGRYISERELIENWDFENLSKDLKALLGEEIGLNDLKGREGLTFEKTEAEIINLAIESFKRLEKQYNDEIMRFAEKRFLLLTLDQLWKDHLLMLDHLRQGIGLRAYGQKDPLIEYKKEAFNLFKAMLDHLRVIVIQRIGHMEITVERNENIRNQPLKGPMSMVAPNEPVDVRPAPSGMYGNKVGRNEICPCGSGKKYKQCCGKI